MLASNIRDIGYEVIRALVRLAPKRASKSIIYVGIAKRIHFIFISLFDLVRVSRLFVQYEQHLLRTFCSDL